IDALIPRRDVLSLLADVAHVHLAAELHRAECHLTNDESGIPQFPIPHLPYSLPLRATICYTDCELAPIPRVDLPNSLRAVSNQEWFSPVLIVGHGFVARVPPHYHSPFSLLESIARLYKAFRVPFIPWW